jgi:hypothetical protein
MQLSNIDVTAVHTSAQFTLGTVAELTTSQGTKKYKYVLYDTGAGGVAAASGNVCYVYAVSGASAGQVTTVTSDLSDSAGVGAGVLQSAPADGEYCWIQIRGQATLTTALTAGADGNALTPVGATDGTLDVSALVTDHICAIAIDASAKLVFCQFPE